MWSRKIRLYNISQQRTPMSKSVPHSSIHSSYPKEKILADIRPCRKPQIEAPSAHLPQATEQIHPVPGKIFFPTRHMLRPRHNHRNDLVNQALPLHHWNGSRTPHQRDMCLRIVQPEILEERRQHHEVTEIPVLDDQNALRVALP